MVWRAMPLLPVAGAFAAGIALAPWTPAATAWGIWILAVTTAGACLALAAAGRGRRAALDGAAAALLAGVAALGALRAADPPLAPDHVARLALPAAVSLKGRLAAAPTAWAPERTRLLVDVERVDGSARSGRVQVTAYGARPPLAQGQPIAADLRLHRATGFRNPGTFDYAAHLAREGILVVGSVRADRIVPGAEPQPPWHARVRRRAIAAMERALPPVSAALLSGLLVGERTALPPELHEGFRRAGVYHVLAVSGFNVALLAGAVWGLAAAVGARQRIAAGVAIVAVLAFAAVVGPQPSVLRAAIMAALVLLALLLEREAVVANSLALAALVILAVRPGDLRDPGFQLSFAATAGIVAAPIPRRALPAALGVSAAAQVAVLPITLAHFNQFSTVGLLANLGVVPLAGIATIVGLLAVVVGFASEPLAAPLFDAVWPALLLMRAIVALAAAVPGAVVHLPAPGPVAIAGYAAAAAAALAAWRERRERPRRARRAAIGALALLIAAAGLAAWPVLRPPDGRLHVTVLDVGQGDAIVIEAPDGRAVLVDAGPGGPWRLDAGERVVAPFLWNRGHLRLAATVVTHADADHAGGMPAVRRRFAVAESWDADALARGPRWLGGAMITLLAPPPAPDGPPLAAPLDGRAAGAGGRPGAGGGAGGATFPGPRPPGRRNDAALVLRVEMGLASFLLASDIEAAAERALTDRRAPLAATVLKVAHHGARTSSTPGFLAVVRPAIAVVSVGARNAYGHPDAATLARLAAGGARVYRTDRDGAVLLETDGRALRVTAGADGRVERYCLDPEAIC